MPNTKVETTMSDLALLFFLRLLFTGSWLFLCISILSCDLCTIFLIFQSLGLLNKKSITESIVKQLDIFQKSFGQLPDFIDGHYHLHQTKVPCDILIHILEEKEFAGWVRSTSMHSELNNLSIIM